MGGRSALGVQAKSTEQVTTQIKQGRKVSRLLGPDEDLCH